MLKLHGFSASNYYNIVKLALLEKGADFQEVIQYTGASSDGRPQYLAMSPLGKVPCLETEHGALSESRCIVDYIEQTVPGPALYPVDPFARAKVAELAQVIELYLELPARRLLPNYLLGKSAPERIAAEVQHELTKGAQALGELGSLEGYLRSGQFTVADITAVIHLPVVREVVRTVLGRDPLTDLAGVDAYLQRMEARPTVKRIRKDQAANYPEFIAHLRQHA